MSIRKIQTQRILEDVIRYLYATGTNPTLSQILEEVSRYFRKYPVGTPLPMPVSDDLEDKLVSIDFMNQIAAHASLNIETLYDVVGEQLGSLVDLNALLSAQLETLKTKRKVITDQVDSYLLSLYDTDGYYYSIGDTFNDLTLTDRYITTAFIDVAAGNVSLPILSSLTKRMSAERIQVLGPPMVYVDGQRQENVRNIADVVNAFDGFTNTVWAIEVETSNPAEVVVTLEFVLFSGDVDTKSSFKLSKIEYNPYGITEVQTFCEVHSAISSLEAPTLAGLLNTGSREGYIQFGHKVQTSESKMSFTDDAENVDRVLLTLRKTKADYVEEVNGSLKHKYIFGAKEIGIYQAVFDQQAVWVSQALKIPEEFGDHVIDAVSIVANTHIPANTELDFYVAPEPTAQTAPFELGDFGWRAIDPIDPNITSSNRNVISFKGARKYSPMISAVRENASDLQLILEDTTNSDLSKRNPTSAIIPGVDIYRLCEFNDEALQATIKLEEGVNTTHITYIDLDSTAVDSIAYWSTNVFKKNLGTHTYGRIDTGNEFFYGGDVGSAGKSVFVETYLECDNDREVLIGELRKSDGNSKSWDVTAFLNGREVASLDASIEKAQISWKFNKGLNHVALLINIPQATDAIPTPYIGTISLLGSYQLQDLGTVKLSDWSYTSLFDMSYNETEQPKTFTIHNGEIISRRKPAGNFRLSYAKDSGDAPAAIRLRADLKRHIDSPRITPRIDSFRIRFAYE